MNKIANLFARLKRAGLAPELAPTPAKASAADLSQPPRTMPQSKITQIARLALYLNDAYYTRPYSIAFGYTDLENLERVTREILGR
ncbi:MAG: hypothetical protein ACTTIC_00720 [Helicobacteraceae bacterium]